LWLFYVEDEVRRRGRAVSGTEGTIQYMVAMILYMRKSGSTKETLVPESREDTELGVSKGDLANMPMEARDLKGPDWLHWLQIDPFCTRLRGLDWARPLILISALNSLLELSITN
jgi:hypothetical protein